MTDGCDVRPALLMSDRRATRSGWLAAMRAEIQPVDSHLVEKAQGVVDVTLDFVDAVGLRRVSVPQQIEGHDSIALRMGGNIQAKRFEVPADAVEKNDGFRPFASFDQAGRQPSHIDPAMRKADPIHGVPVTQDGYSLSAV
jgi:hypothetical protein